MDRIVFTENIKVADVILTNERLLCVLPHFRINLGFGDKTIKEICAEQNISAPLLLLVCNVYTFDGYLPCGSELEQVPVAGILEYLRNSHRYYNEVCLPQIRNALIKLEDVIDSKTVGNMMSCLGGKYEQQIFEHTRYEEEVVFPYIMRLLGGENPGDYKIEEYTGKHFDINSNDAINDLKNIIIKYLPKGGTIENCKDILFKLFIFEYVLSKHKLIEDKILVPLVKNMEEKYAL